MTPREERGLVLAATAKLTRKGKVWIVPSQTGNGKKYTVCPDANCPYCSCPDHEETGQPCKHVFAVRFVQKREEAPDGTVTETREVRFTEKKTYPPRGGWGCYNLAQSEEKRRFLALLHDLCKGLPNPPPNALGGRRRTDIGDMAFTVIYKIFSTLSGRRFGTDLEESFAKGYLTRKLNGVMVWKFMECDLLTPVLQKLVTLSAIPLRAVETTFAPDSTGFSTSRFTRWFDMKYNGVRTGRDWVKAHCIAGVRTHVITAVEIHGRDAADSPQFKPLVESTAEHFDVRAITADKAYLSNDNLQLVHDMGATPYIPFKVNSTSGEPGSVWEKMYHFYSMNREEFDKKYHQRSNVESAFSMLKAKFRDDVRSKSEVAMKNEVLCKVIAHNVCCLIMSQIELGIDVQFWGKDEPKRVEPVTVETPVQEVAVAKVNRICAGA